MPAVYVLIDWLTMYIKLQILIKQQRENPA